MATFTERRVAYGLGLVGGGLILAGSLLSLLTGVADMALGRPIGALAAASAAVVLFVVGGLSMLFAYLTHRAWADRPLAGGVVLAALALVGWLFLGLGANAVTIIGGLFVFLGGLLFLIEPTKQALATAVPA